MSDCTDFKNYIDAKLTDHPSAHGQTWGQHCVETLKHSGRSLAAGLTLFVHALFPCAFPRWGETQIEKVATEIRLGRPVEEQPFEGQH